MFMTQKGHSASRKASFLERQAFSISLFSYFVYTLRRVKLRLPFSLTENGFFIEQEDD
jgi:hypothetical protein